MDFGVILTTTSNLEEAKNIAHNLVEQKLAACVNIIPKIISVYRWENKINEEEEYMLVIKSRKSSFKQIKQAIINIHTYELPEIILLPIKKGFSNYLGWIEEETLNFKDQNNNAL